MPESQKTVPIEPLQAIDRADPDESLIILSNTGRMVGSQTIVYVVIGKRIALCLLGLGEMGKKKYAKNECHNLSQIRGFSVIKCN